MSRARAAHGPSRMRGNWWWTWATQDPDGLTTAWKGSKVSIQWRASRRPSPGKPELRAGCPQQLWASGKLTRHPMASRTSTAARAGPGAARSAMQLAKRATLAGGPGGAWSGWTAGLVGEEVGGPSPARRDAGPGDA